MPSLFINIKIDSEEKFDLFIVTLADIVDLFEEYHIKIRGKYSKECIEFIEQHVQGNIYLYQHLTEKNWVVASLEMLQHVVSRSVFLYFEDHRLLCSKNAMSDVLNQIDEYNIDYLCYSFFRSSRLSVNNLLPLMPHHYDHFDSFVLSKHSLPLLGSVAPSCYTFSLLSICSVEYFKSILMEENKRMLLHFKKVNSAISRILPYPKSKYFINYINKFFSRVGIRVCMHDPSSPFNLEKMWFESSACLNKTFNFGVLKKELYANYDDDNGADGESLIKKGLYPFNANISTNRRYKIKNVVGYELSLDSGDQFDCTYYSNKMRITDVPIITIEVIEGKINVNYNGDIDILSSGRIGKYYTNLHPIIKCYESSKILLKIYDSAFD